MVSNQGNEKGNNKINIPSTDRFSACDHQFWSIFYVRFDELHAEPKAIGKLVSDTN